MNLDVRPHQVTLEPNDSQRLANLCGPYDQHLRQIEERLGITIKNRGNDFQLTGENKTVVAAGELLSHLYREVSTGTSLTSDLVHLFLQESGVDALLQHEADGTDDLLHTSKKIVRPRGKNQINYVRAIKSNDINFGIGPAGTGKTYLAVACAVEAYEREAIRRILLVSPAEFLSLIHI